MRHIVTGTETGLAAVAWLVAGALALGAGGLAFGMKSHRRRREAEARLDELARAVREFSGALRARITVQRDRLQEASREGRRERPEKTGIA